MSNPDVLDRHRDLATLCAHPQADAEGLRIFREQMRGRAESHPLERVARAIAAAEARCAAFEALCDWVAAHELGAVHLLHRRNMSEATSTYQVLLTARDSLDQESGWLDTAGEACAAMVELLEPEGSVNPPPADPKEQQP